MPILVPTSRRPVNFSIYLSKTGCDESGMWKLNSTDFGFLVLRTRMIEELYRDSTILKTRGNNNKNTPPQSGRLNTSKMSAVCRRAGQIYSRGWSSEKRRKHLYFDDIIFWHRATT